MEKTLKAILSIHKHTNIQVSLVRIITKNRAKKTLMFG